MSPTRTVTTLLLAVALAGAGGCSGRAPDERAAADAGTTPVASPGAPPAGLAGKAVRLAPAPLTGGADSPVLARVISAQAPAATLPMPAPAQLGGALREPFELGALRPPAEALERERYAHFDDNPLRRVAEQPVSTFSVDVDTGSYANVRRLLRAGRLPPRDAVRLEEMLNYFDYAYPAPGPGEGPFRVTTEIAPSPWNPDTVLVHIGIKGREVAAQALPPANLVFLVDVSGSMASADKLPLLRSALKLLARRLRAEDRVSLVVYAGASGVVLEPTPGDQRARIEAAIDRLGAGGRTNGAAGIRLAYTLAEQAFIAGGINRVLLATDGDFNVGTVDIEALLDLVARKRAGGVALTTLGLGTGNYNERLLERLADAGDGNYAYLDSLHEARKVLVEQLGATLHTIARDVKVQLEFNPARVAEYRLLGYENRALRREDFANDRVDAGEIGAGHTVTALYEVALAGSPGVRSKPLRYAPRGAPPASHGDELAFLRLRYKAPAGGPSRLIEVALRAAELRPAAGTSQRFRFAAAVAAFAQILRGGRYLGDFDLDRTLELARAARGPDPHGRRGELLALIELARALGAQAGRRRAPPDGAG